jgi:hypothetical protein
VSEPTLAGGARNRSTLGLVLIGLGLVLSLESAGVLSMAGLGRWWPLLLVGVGIVKVKEPRANGQRAAGTAFLMLGCLFLTTTILSFGHSWPLLMVGVGMFLLWQGVEGPRGERAGVAESPYLSDMALIGVIKRTHRSADFRGGSITATIGGMELDLRKAAIVRGTAYIDVVAFWGGIEIKVPPEWAVDARVIPIMGAFENKAASLGASGAPRLVVRGHAIMGAVLIGS